MSRRNNPKESEKQFQTAVIELAILRGWKHYHTYRSKRSVPGFPDLVLVRERIIFAELKREGGEATPQQQEWLDAIAYADGTAYLWQPSDWNEILRELT